MNISRLVKLKEINGDLINLTDEERFIISFFYDLKKVNDTYVKDDVVYFQIYEHNFQGISKNLDYKVYIMYCNYNKIWLPVYRKYKLLNVQISNLIKNLFLDYFDIHFITVSNKYYYP